MRVLVVTPDFPPAVGGVQLLTRRLSAHLGDRVEVVTLDAPGAGDHDDALPFTVSRVGARSHRAGIALLNAAAIRRARAARPDVVLSMHVVAGAGAFAAARVSGSRYVQYVHADELRTRRAIARAAVRRADLVIAVSRHTRSIAVELGARPDDVQVVPNGVDPPMRAPDVDADRSPIIVTVSRLAELYKGHDVMMRAMPLVRARVAQARWIVIGDGPLRPFLAGLASAWGLGAAVEFTGRLPEGERDAWLNRAAVFAMPSRLPVGGGGEGFGIAYLEAAARGVPAVAGSVGGAPDAVVDQQTGLLVDPVDHLEVADAVVRLLTDAQLARRMRREALVHAAHHRWEAIGGRVERLLSELIDHRGA